ncbi:hypothetical protein AB0395_37780 [Streptosporangium sp. NPDC051023]|uniref:hypothetical protein n=1 Tax=Streptosporangium sp. NPDC051023 TaxID=3155410 RepID=UPI00344B7FFE
MSTLEDRYRRLLAFYPREHRARHGEEMVGVMLATAGAERRRPDPGDVLDIVKGGLQIRLRHAFGPESAVHWRDALNIAAIVAPLHLLVSEVGTWGMALWVAGALLPILTLLPIALTLLQFLVLVLALRGMRRAAAAGAWISLAANVAMSVRFRAEMPVSSGQSAVSLPLEFPFVSLGTAFDVLPVLVVALLLTFAPRPAEGAALIGRRRLLHWAVTAALTLNVVGALEYFLTPEIIPDGMATTALVCMACGAASRTPAGRRVLVLLLPPLVVIYQGVPLSSPYDSDWFPTVVRVMVATVIFIVARRGFRPYGSGTVSFPEPLA